MNKKRCCAGRGAGDQCGTDRQCSRQGKPRGTAKLGKELTCTGAERAGNADGSIPEFTGKYLGEVPGWNHVRFSGQKPVDPYADEKPVAVITARTWPSTPSA